MFVEDARRARAVVLILGCKVGRDGAPSAAMRRRVEAARRLERSLGPVLFVPIGGVGRWGPAEALVMQRLLREAGVPDDAIQPVAEGANTIHSLRACWPVLVEVTGGLTRSDVYVCTDRYHLPRCRAILRIWGAPTRAAVRPRDEEGAGERSSYMLWRDRLALLKDVPRAFWWRATRQLMPRRSRAGEP
jgi:vancomycin permeability regulator SanA